MRYITFGLIGILFLLIGCASVDSYNADLKETQAMIEETSQYAYEACQDNQSRAVASSVIAQRMGKPFITPDVVNSQTKEEVESRWMQIEMQYGSLANPPEGCKEKHELVKRMYEACQKLCQLAANPVGPVEQYQQTTDVLYEAVATKGSELNGMYAGV